MAASTADRGSAEPASPSNSSRDPLLAAAREQFLSHGYAGASLERIAAQAGVARQTIYNRYGSKDALFRAVLTQHWAAMSSGDSLDGVRGILDSPTDALTAAGTAIADFVRSGQQVAFTRMVIRESVDRAWIGAEFFKAGKLPALTQLVDILAEMGRRGSLECQDPDLAARQFIGMIQEFLIWPLVMGVSEEDLPQQTEAAVISEAVQTFMARYAVAT